jgi:hypothetical protein
LADVDEKTLGLAVKKVETKAPSPKTCFDYRKMHDDCHKEIGAEWHAAVGAAPVEAVVSERSSLSLRVAPK